MLPLGKVCEQPLLSLTRICENGKLGELGSLGSLEETLSALPALSALSALKENIY